MSARQPRLWEPEVEPYRRPTMDEIAGRPSNGYVAVGSFSGCGGSSLGLKMAGWQVPYAVEFIPAAADTYQANFPEAFVDRRDIRQIKVDEILERIELEPGELDLFEGSPPCASFSHAGSRSKYWGEEKAYSDGVKQRTDDLFWEWMRLLEGLQPRAFLAENVPGMLNGPALEEYAWKIHRRLRDLGYRVNTKVVNAAWYGVPQDRERLLFIGLREDVAGAAGGVWPEFPPPTTPEPRTLREALESAEPFLDESEVEEASREGSRTGDSWRAKREALDANGMAPVWESLPCRRCERPMSEHRELEYSGGGNYLVGGTCEDGEPADPIRNYFMVRLGQLDDPSPTLVAMSDMFHSTENRYMLTAEYLSIAGFPPDFKLTGRRAQRRERVGRAVPPLVYEAMGRRLAEYLDRA